MDSLSTIILGGALFVIMLGMGLSLRVADFKRIVIDPKAVCVGLTNQLLILPLIGLLIASYVTNQPEIAVGIMILSACPGGPTSNLISYMAKGDLALSVTLTALSSLITILTMPLIITYASDHFRGTGQEVVLDIPSTILQIFGIVVIPIVLGMLVRRFKTSFAERMGRPVRIASGIVLALIIIGLVLKEKANFVSYFKQAGLATLLLNVLTMGVGYYSAKVFKLRKEAGISIAIESGIQNGTLAITIAVVFLQNSALAIAPAVYSLLMFLTGGVMIYFFGRRSS